jgi:hypothetical protein
MTYRYPYRSNKVGCRYGTVRPLPLRTKKRQHEKIKKEWCDGEKTKINAMVKANKMMPMDQWYDNSLWVSTVRKL